jgi:hypothetical protein
MFKPAFVSPLGGSVSFSGSFDTATGAFWGSIPVIEAGFEAGLFPASRSTGAISKFACPELATAFGDDLEADIEFQGINRVKIVVVINSAMLEVMSWALLKGSID